MEKEKKHASLTDSQHSSLVVDPMDFLLVTSIGARRRNLTKPGILIVDDDPFFLLIAKKCIKDNFIISTAADGKEAISGYIRSTPDLVFLDIQLPDVSGLDLLAKFIEIDPHAYVVMLSGDANQKNILKASERGAKGFVGKPFTAETISHRIEKCFSVKNRSIDGVS